MEFFGSIHQAVCNDVGTTDELTVLLGGQNDEFVLSGGNSSGIALAAAGRRSEVCDLLTSIYDAFTEGFGTVDLAHLFAEIKQDHKIANCNKRE